MSPRRASAALVVALGIGFIGAVAGSCRTPARPPSAEPAPVTSLRLFAVANLASAIEPCGCQKDMLGGIDHAATLLAHERAHVDHHLLVAAGPTFFLDPVSTDEGRQQDAWKAGALAQSLREVGLVAWTPGANDFGRDVSIEQLAELSGAPWVAANVETTAPRGADALVLQRGPVRVGITGVTIPPKTTLPRDLDLTAAEDALRRGLGRLRQRGAELFIALVAAPRGEALRLVDRVDGFHVALVGKPIQSGDGNDSPSPPVLIDDTLVIQPSNLLQTVGVVDFRLVGDDFELEDAGGIRLRQERERLDRRIEKLEERIAMWKQRGANPSDVAARRRDLEGLREERAALDASPEVPGGSWLRYSLLEVREEVGVDEAVKRRIDQYYRRVNEHNRVAFADRKPPPVEEGRSSYAGAESCVACHEEADAFWKTTRHAAAYATLVERHTEYNLECVGCHVTGYERPGGSTVANVEGLRNVQCEVCHGPGSRHNAQPADPSLITLTPEETLCASLCHKPPHVPDDWNVKEKWPLILGPGHGEPLPESPADAASDEALSPDEALDLLDE